MATKKARKAGPQTAKRAPRSQFQPELDRKADRNAKQAGTSGSTLGMFSHRSTKPRGGR